MEVLNPRSALLSNFEVLTLLRELESDHLARAKTALRIKEEDQATGGPNKLQPIMEEVPENLRTIEVEAIQYLMAEYQPTFSQSESGVTQLVKELASYDLTKAEKLQIVNLAPTEPVELYTIVEELEERLSDQMDRVLGVVRNSLSHGAVSADPVTIPTANEGVEVYEERLFLDDDQTWEYDATDVVFDDTGQGAGVEGDLEEDEE